ncbi:uroporphyrinogen-III C-methyltransferase [Anaerocolumna sedimenticola]|uniref:uroporphyrinogen-III C-methyltransferase n=1 Tax=Anaerocolumna sedimenticola TaxID=2696063 RepID=A0A6P1TSL0_9FIRM|nr:uroporphyrinogen-III C-methyltransferase [Anaerocolumna sedimenticola]QHQ62438.1 uroporphyrinogen-III C-methyltransferase [Anaerocolumna sedimenticola]
MNKNGMVYLVGAGPGDPELLTLKGKARLEECEVVIYDRLASDSLLDFVPYQSEKIYVGKEVGRHSFNQEAINQIIIEKALEGKRVVRLKGGDPFVFGRGGEEVIALQKAGIPFQVIPGITSAIAAATYAGIPVTHRGISRSFHVVTGHTKDTDNELVENFETLAKLEGTLIFLMGMGNLSLIVNELIRYGKDGNTPAAVISNGTTNQQKTVRGTLLTIEEKVKEENIQAPAVILIGAVTELDMKSLQYGRLSGLRIGVTGTPKLTEKLTNQLRNEEAYVDNLSFLYVKETEELTELKRAIDCILEYTWIVFTSTNGVDLFFQYLKENQFDYRKLGHISFAVVGNGTKEALMRQGFIADYMPEVYTTVSLAHGLVKSLKKEDKVLIPRAVNGSKDLTQILSDYSIPYTDIKLYSIETDKEKYNRITSNLLDYDYLTFASASGVEGFFRESDSLKLNTGKTKIVCIGDITAKKLNEYGITNYLIAREYSVPGLVDCIMEDIKKV